MKDEIVHKDGDLLIVDLPEGKVLQSPNYNYIFDKSSGEFIRYGTTKEDDPTFSPYGPEIVDMEITTICSGPKGKLCKFCYKSNNPHGKNMSFNKFKRVFDNLPKTVTQIAYGADANCTANPDIWRIMEYTRTNGVIPNITVADVSEDIAEKLADYCGAVAVSRYDDKDVCYDSVKMLTDKGMDQVNIHLCIHKDNLDQVHETLKDIIVNKDPRLDKLNAIVFLSLKKKGRGEGFEPLPIESFVDIVDTCLSNGVRFGFDSCSAQKFLYSIQSHEHREEMTEMVEPCESSSFSAYINVDGMYSPCSFVDGEEGWKMGFDTWFDVENCDDFVNDIWNHEKNVKFRDQCKICNEKGISCQVFDI